MGGGRGGNWKAFTELYKLLAGRASHHANQYAQMLTFAADDDDGKVGVSCLGKTSQGEELSTQLLVEATTAVDFIRQAHTLLIPIVA